VESSSKAAVGPYWGIFECGARAEICLGPARSSTRDYWKACDDCRSRRHPDVATDPEVWRSRPCVAVADVCRLRRNGVGAWVANTCSPIGPGHYFVFGSALCLDARPDPAGGPLVLIAMAEESGRNRRHRLRPKAAPLAGQRRRPSPTTARVPRLSIHIPAYFEPPEMLKQNARCGLTARLSELRMRRDHQQHAPIRRFWQTDPGSLPRALGERFKFINAEKV